MKYSSRKLAGANSKSSSALSSSSSFSSSAAAVSVSKFGQATFTSVRRKDYENGSTNFVPLKNTVSEDSNAGKKEVEVKPQTPKPKVYKFFKSRAPVGDKTPGNKSSHTNTSPKALVLNSATKNDGIKRITATIGRGSASSIRNKADKNATHGQASRTVSFSENSTSQIKDVRDQTDKKVISPTKTTQFFIRNSSNVRNATVKPAMTPSSNIVPVSSRGKRTSRRLKGIEPEPVSNSKRKSQTIHLVFDRSVANEQNSSPPQNSSFGDENSEEPVQEGLISNNSNITTTIEEVKDNSEEENEQNDDNEKMEFGDKEPLEREEEEKEAGTGEEEMNHENGFDKMAVETPLIPEIAQELPIASQSDQTASQPEISSQQETNSDWTYTDSQPLDSQPIEEPKQESKLIAPRPKKKIFSNRENRSKVEFNTKSFFASTVKDEFDMELDGAAANASAPSSNVEKKNGQENEEDDQYIKLKRIKKAYQCHDLGETSSFDEDIKYYLSGIVSKNAQSMRCLSILGLTQQAMRPEFRMHLRAHDDMPRIIKALMDAPQDPNLAICTATLMFVYNQDRLTMDIDPNALSLILDLLETRSDECNQVEEKHRVKVKSLVEEMKNKGHAKYMKLTEITAGKLAMETLLGLTSKRAGDWFKVELRKMKGIDVIVDSVLRCAENYSEEGQMIKIDRCMHVLENVTFNNVENQVYISSYNERKFISTCISLLKNCKSKIIGPNDSKVFLSAFFSILRVLTNLTSESVEGCKMVGSFNGILELLLEAVFELPTFIATDQRFDLMVILLCLCINLVEFCEHIRELVINSEENMIRLTDFLFKKIEEAAQVEQATDHLLESHETVQMTEALQDNLLMQMISKSGTHMEHSLLSACVCLLFGCCIQENDDYMQILKDTLPNNSFDPLIEMLEKLRDFAHLADIMTQKGKDRVQRVLQIFKLYKQNM